MSEGMIGTQPLQRTRSRKISLLSVLACGVIGGSCFYVGFTWGINMGLSQARQDCSEQTLTARSTAVKETELAFNRKLEECSKDLKSLKEKVAAVEEKSAALSLESQRTASAAAKKDGNSPSDTRRFPNSISKVAHGMALVNRDEFAAQFDTGVPLDQSTHDNQDVLILYNSPKSLPSKMGKHDEARMEGQLPTMTTHDATENCDFLNIILNQPTPKRAQCIAIIGQYEAFHIQKYMRLPLQDKQPINRTVPLRLVNRGAQENGRKSTKPPTQKMTMDYWNVLQPYLRVFPKKLKELTPVTQAMGRKDNNGIPTIIVMVCNHGQSELLLNWACAMKARDMDTSMVLLFATDEETRDLGKSLGLRVYFDRDLFGDMPKNAARAYADNTFTKMMMAKLYCVQLTLMTGVNVLFQDVDVVTFKDPLPYFQDESLSGDFDVYFQDDGNHALYYSPYSANTGFYYVRYNDRTQYFFNSFLLAGDIILSTHSHQISLIALLNEHASMYALKVKILTRDGDEFPGGYHYHNRKAYMKDLFAKKVDPFVFHMSWTSNKDNKIKFFQQMGEWFVADDKICVGKTVEEIGGSGNVLSTCCARQPIVTCHYKDKPSKHACTDAESIDKRGRSWW